MSPVEKDPGAQLNGAVAAVLRGELAARTDRMTQKALAEVSGIPVISLSRYLNGQRHLDVNTLAAICEAMDLEPAWVLQQATARLAGSGIVKRREELVKQRDELVKHRSDVVNSDRRTAEETLRETLDEGNRRYAAALAELGQRIFESGVDLSFVDDSRVPDLRDRDAVEAWLDESDYPAGLSQEDRQRLRDEVHRVLVALEAATARGDQPGTGEQQEPGEATGA